MENNKKTCRDIAHIYFREDGALIVNDFDNDPMENVTYLMSAAYMILATKKGHAAADAVFVDLAKGTVDSFEERRKHADNTR